MNNVFEILKATNYYIRYHHFSKKSKSEIYISWTDTSFTIEYDNKTKRLTCQELELDVECQRASVPSLVYLLLQSIVKELKYPYRFVFFKIDGNTTNSFFFELPNLNAEELNNIMSLQYIIEDFNSGGLTADHFSMLLEQGMLPYFNDIIKAKYNVKMEFCNE